MPLTSTFWIDFSSWLAIAGAFVVVIGILLESAELLIKFKREIKCRKWVVRKFGKKWRRELIFCGRRVKPKLFWPFEVLGFAILVVGLIIEMIGSFSAERLQSKENAVLSLLAANIGTTNAQLVAENLVLRSNVAALELQVMETSNNVANANPSNQPLKSLTAVVTLVVLTGRTREHPLEDPIIPSNGWNMLTLRIFASNAFMAELHQDNAPLPLSADGQNQPGRVE